MSFPSDDPIQLFPRLNMADGNREQGQTDTVIASGVQPAHSEESHLFNDRAVNSNSLTSEQAFMHMIKAMLGTGLLSLPLAFKHAGLYLGLFLMILVCLICLYSMRLIVYAGHHVCAKTGREVIDYANIMKGAVENGPAWIQRKAYFFKQLVNFNVFIAQLGFCCVYFVFMADNLQDFFAKNYNFYLSKSMWMMLAAIPVTAICSIRRLNRLAPFAMLANVIYLVAVVIVVHYFLTHLKDADDLTKVGKASNLPLFFGMALYSFEGVSVIMVIENRMQYPQNFIAWNGVLNSSCLVVLAIFSVVGFYGYLAVGDGVADAVTLNLPDKPFYQILKLMFVACVIVSYPIQFFVPLERVEKWISRKCPAEKHTQYSYLARFALVACTLAVAEMVPHLGLFIALIGAFSCSVLALLFPPVIDLLIAYSRNNLTHKVIFIDFILLCFFFIGFTTGTYSALSDIMKTFH